MQNSPKSIDFIFNLACLLICIFLSNSLYAQIDSTRTENNFVTVTLKDKTVVHGSLIEQTADSIVILVEGQQIVNLNKDKVKSIKFTDGSKVNDSQWFDNPNASRHFFWPTAFNLKQGEVSYHNISIFLHTLNVGITDWFSMGVGMEFVYTFATGKPVFWLTPKVGFPIGKDWQLGGGAYYVNNVFGIGDLKGIALLYTNTTYGTRDNNVSAGIGYGLINGQFSNKPTFMLGGTIRLSKKIGLVTENWFLAGDKYYPLLTYGVRVMNNTVTLDFGFANSKDIVKISAIGIPFIDFYLHFGKKN